MRDANTNNAAAAPNESNSHCARAQYPKYVAIATLIYLLVVLGEDSMVKVWAGSNNGARRTRRPYSTTKLSAIESKCKERAGWLETAMSSQVTAPTTMPSSVKQHQHHRHHHDGLDSFYRSCLVIRRACLLENDIVLMGPPEEKKEEGGAESDSESGEVEVQEPTDVIHYSIRDPHMDAPSFGDLAGDLQHILYNRPGWHDGLNGTQMPDTKFPLNIRVRSNLDPPELALAASSSSDVRGMYGMSKVPLVLVWRTWPYNFNECGKWIFDLASLMIHGEQQNQNHQNGAKPTSGSSSGTSNPDDDLSLPPTGILGFALVPPMRTRIASFWSLLGPPITPSTTRSYYDAARHCPGDPAPCFEKLYICDERAAIPRADSKQLETVIDRMVEGSCSKKSFQKRSKDKAAQGEPPADSSFDVRTLRVWIDDANRPGPKKRELLNPEEIVRHCQNETINWAGREIKLICNRGPLTDSAAMACDIREYDVLIVITGASVANGLFLRKGGSIIQIEHEKWSPIAAEDNWGGQPMLNRLDTLQPLHYRAPEEDTEESPIVPWCRKKGEYCGIAMHRDASIRVSWPLLVPLLEKAVEHRNRYNSMVGTDNNKAHVPALGVAGSDDGPLDRTKPRPPATSQRIAYVSPVNLATKNTGTEYFSQRAYGTKRFEDVIIASLDTWFAGSNEPYYLVISDTQRDLFYEEKFCGDGSKYERYCKRIVPIFVDCQDTSHLVVCCKYEKGLLQMFENYGGEYDWFLYKDDDIYIRRDLFIEYTKPLDPSDVAVLSSGRTYAWLSKLGEAGVWGKYAQYNCSSDLEYMYPWGLVAAYSRGALERAAVGFQAGGLVKQCFEYGVMSDHHSVGQDCGSAIFNWMHSFPTLPIHVAYSANITSFRYFGIHAQYENNLRRFALKETHEFYSNAPPAETYNFTYRWHNVTGFHRTAIHKDFGDPWTWADWNTMNISDCKGDDPSKWGEPYGQDIEPYMKPWG